ncbi:MAG: M28 family peptidase [Anaerolineales bacterium]|nr:M28 family metallopeptidase [Anaerolineales bacterium]MCS7248906.1 M28 family metallopeptidase [Anaerolineales bacterium]MDW8162719.1 M28 family peptidase [Anaerolineales bacterium]MDW8446674.1 M28 family peptidase [Anaerolineales bacterium]
MEASLSTPVKRWLEHVRVLAVEIGPRGSTRQGERRGSLYVKEQFEKLGLQPKWETFRSARSIFHPHLIGAILMLVAFLLFPLGGRLTAALAAGISILVLVNEVLELSFRNNLFRWIVPKGDSQNVYAVLPPQGEHHADLILVGHIDTQRTPLIFKNKTWVKLYDRFTFVAFAAFILQAVLYSLAALFGWTWVWYPTIFTAICAILLALMCVQAELTPFTPGANDNATAVGMVLTLVEEFLRQPLYYTRVWAVITGCEEVQHYGMIDFYRRHLHELKSPRAVVFEMLGCAGPAWVIREGIVVPFRSNPRMVALAERLSAENPQWGAYPVKISGGNSELSDAVRFGVPGITFFGLTPDGEAPFWHQPEDTFDKMNPLVMEKTWEMVLTFIRRLDREESKL